MGFIESAKEFFGDKKEDAHEMAKKHGEKIADGVDKTTDFVDEKTGGRMAEPLEKVDDFTRDHLDPGKK